MKLSMDIVSEETANVWSRMCGLNIKVKEKLNGIYRTQPEMLILKKQYEKKNDESKSYPTNSIEGR